MPKLKLVRALLGARAAVLGSRVCRGGFWEHGVNLAGCRQDLRLPVKFYPIAFDDRTSLPEPGVSRIDRVARRAIRVQPVSGYPPGTRCKANELAASAGTLHRGHSPKGMKFAAGLIKSGSGRCCPRGSIRDDDRPFQLGAITHSFKMGTVRLRIPIIPMKLYAARLIDRGPSLAGHEASNHSL